MKKYKILKDFPGNNEKIGDFIRFHIGAFPEYFGPSGRRYCAKDIENYPEFLEKVVELDYVILIAVETESKNLEIKSILRKSDNEVFSVGDLVQLSTGKDLWWASDNCKICSFKIHDNKLSFGIEQNTSKGFYSYPLEDWRHVKKPLFVTEDQVEIFNGDDFWAINLEKDKSPTVHKLDYQCNYSVAKANGILWFSTEEAAQTYIDENKPKYSELDMLDFGLTVDYSITPIRNPENVIKGIFKTWKGKNGKN